VTSDNLSTVTTTPAINIDGVNDNGDEASATLYQLGYTKKQILSKKTLHDF
jgi:hypothetical protein